MSGTINFGTAAYQGTVSGLIITSIKFGSTAQAAEAMDENGNIIQVDMYGKKLTVQVEGTVSGDTAALVAGATLTIGGTDYTIESAEVTATNTGHTSASVTASAPMEESSGGNSGGDSNSDGD